MRAAGVDIDVDRVADVALVALSGELDLAAAPRVRAVLHRMVVEGAHEIVVDLRRIEFLDGSGVNALLRAQRAAYASSSRVMLCEPRGQPRRLLDLVGVGVV